MPAITELHVFLDAEHVGTLYDTNPVTFEYAPAWLSRPNTLAITTIPLQTGQISSAAVSAFFENLLPEGDLRHYIMTQRKASTLFSLLKEVAGDTAGAFVILPAGQTPQPPHYQPTSWATLAKQLDQPSTIGIGIQGHNARISLAGAQDKISIAIFKDGVPCLPLGTAASTHILKPNIKRFVNVWHSSANEAIVMLAAAYCGLPTAKVFYQPDTQACAVRRFDRYNTANGSLGRIIQYDLCQLSATVSEKKYENEGGPGLADCANLLRLHSTQTAVDLQHLVRWVFFNLFVGNNDSHAKNLSMFCPPEGGMVLTPFYDLMCTRLYPGLSSEFAFSVGGETKPGAISNQHIITMAADLNMQAKFVLRLATELAEKMPKALQLAVDTVSPDLSQSARVLAERLQRFVLSTTAKTIKRLTAPN